MKRICLLILLMVWVWSLMAIPGDSVGMKQVSGQTFIIYKLSAGETAYAVSRKYSVSYKSIAEANPEIDLNAIQLGQEILIPRVYVTSTTTKTQSGNVHIVAKGETVYSISKQYNTDVAALQKANPEIQNNAIKIGQVFNIPLNGQAIAQIENKTVEVNTHKADAIEVTNASSETLTDINSPSSEITYSRTDKNKSFPQMYAEYRSMDLVSVSEKGVATWIDGSADMQITNGRYYALNNDAPIGSVVKVRNLMNNREIYAKVIGTLSDTEISDKTLIKLSAGAADQLNVLDARFVAEITHYEAREEVSK